MEEKDLILFGKWVRRVAVVLAVLLVIGLFWRPVMGPWIQMRQGAANLARAEQERQILVAQARAEKEAAQLRADAIKILGEAAQQFPEYRNQEFIGAFAEALTAGKIQQIIYVPTEANIPVLEAGKAPPR